MINTTSKYLFAICHANALAPPYQSVEFSTARSSSGIDRFLSSDQSIDALLKPGSLGKIFGRKISSTPIAFSIGTSNFLADVWLISHITLIFMVAY